MKITIVPFEKKEEKIDLITLYNLIKRSSEDLRSNYPGLQEFILEIRMYPTFIKYNSVARSKYTISEDGSTITLIIASYPSQLPQKVYLMISECLSKIKSE